MYAVASFAFSKSILEPICMADTAVDSTKYGRTLPNTSLCIDRPLLLAATRVSTYPVLTSPTLRLNVEVLQKWYGTAVLETATEGELHA
jgi:hypothetical protein